MESKVGRILLIISGIIHLIIVGAVLLVFLIIFAIAPSEIPPLVIIIIIIVALIFIFLGIFKLICAKWMKNPKTTFRGGLAALIAGVFTGDIIAIIGGIFGIVNSQE